MPATLFNGDETVTREGRLDSLPRRIGRSALLWLDVERDGPDLQRAAELLKVEEGTVRRIVGETAEPALDDRPRYTHITMCVPQNASDTAELARIDCIVGDRWVVTAHAGPIAVLAELRERARGSGATGRLDGPGFLAMLLEWVLGEYSTAFERVEEQLEELDVRSLRDALGDPEEEIRRLVGLRRDVGALHRALTSHREPLLALTHPELDALSTPESAARFRVLLDRFDVTVQAGRDARASIVASFDVLMARTEHRTNEILKVLTLASVLFLPGSLVAAILGMNFHVPLFDHASVFWVVVGAVLAVIGGTTLAARRYRWI